MENKNQYYYPCREDIREGYECEINNERLREGAGWYAASVGLGYENITFSRALTEVDLKGIRVPFLTKEKIEDEGWEKENILIEEEDEDILAEGLSYHISEDRWFEMHFLPNNEICIIEKYYRNQVTQCWNKRFEGYCPTINEFRTLMRWFNIKKEDGKE